MIPALTEGVRSVILPCTLVLVIPGLIVLATGVRRPVVGGAGYVVAAAVTVWLRATGWLVWDPAGRGAVPAAGVMAAAFVAVWWGSRAGTSRSRSTAGTVVGGAAVGVVSATIWLPCVGEELGDLLSRASAEPWSVAVPLVLFVVGALTPLIAAAAVVVLVGPDRLAPVSTVALILGLVAAALIAIDRHDDIAATLYRWSL